MLVAISDGYIADKEACPKLCIEKRQDCLLNLVNQLIDCGYLESEIYAIARLDGPYIDGLNPEVVEDKIETLQKQLAFAKKCLRVIWRMAEMAILFKYGLNRGTVDDL